VLVFFLGQRLLVVSLGVQLQQAHQELVLL
jgi:hypothetical protein